MSTSEVSRETTDTGTTVTNLTSSVKTVRGKYANSTELQFPDNCIIEFDIEEITGDITLQLWKSNVSGDHVGLDIDNQMSGVSSGHLKVELNGTKVILSVNGTTKLNSNFSFQSSGNMSIRFLLDANASFKYRNFLVYSI